MLIHSLAKRNVHTAQALAVILVATISFYVSFFVAILSAGTVGWAHESLGPEFGRTAAAFLLVSVTLVALLSGMHFGRRRIPAWLNKIFLTRSQSPAETEIPIASAIHPRVMAGATTLQLCIFGLDVLTLWLAFRAIGLSPEIWLVFVAYAAGKGAAVVAPIPLGLGVYEAGSTAFLVAQSVPFEAALIAAMISRGLSIWLPLIPGAWFVHQELRNGDEP